MDIIFITGKGGSGKSSLSLSLAYFLRERLSKQLYLVSLDPAPNLKHIAKIAKLPMAKLKVKEVIPEKLLNKKTGEIIQSFMENFPHMRVITPGELTKAVKESPGAAEMVLFDETIKTIESSQSLDYTIFDMPPTGQALEIILYPFRRLRWLRILKRIRESYHERKKAIEKIRSGSAEFKDPVMENLSGLIQKTQGAINILKEAKFLLVHNPDEVSLKEAREAEYKLRKHGLNRILKIENKGSSVPTLWDKIPDRRQMLKAGEILVEAIKIIQ